MLCSIYFLSSFLCKESRSKYLVEAYDSIISFIEVSFSEGVILKTEVDEPSLGFYLSTAIPSIIHALVIELLATSRTLHLHCKPSHKATCLISTLSKAAENPAVMITTIYKHNYWNPVLTKCVCRTFPFHILSLLKMKFATKYCGYTI